MLSNYLKIALRNIKRHKGYSFINIAGLSIGLTCCLLIMLWVMDELSYDRFHENKDSIYRVEQDQNYSGSVYHVNVTPYPMAEGLIAEIPEVKNATPYPGVGTLLLRYKDNVFFESSARAVTPAFLEMFTYPFIRGDKSTALANPRSMVITKELAEKYFGESDPMGQVISVNNQYDFTVTGVLENIPRNSEIRFDMLVPFEFMKDMGRQIDQWGWNSIITYVQLHDNAVIEEVNKKITDLRFNKIVDSWEDSQEELEDYKKRAKTQFMLNPLVDIHLYSYFGYSHSMGAILYVYIISAIAIFVLLIACINFMNLSTARSANRAKEVGLRKVIGAMKSNLVGQFYGESILLAFIGLFLSIVALVLILPSFGTFVDKEFSLKTLLHWKFLAGMLSVTLLTGIVSGSYPALFLSAFQPVKILRGGISTGAKGSLFRRVLVVLQFTLSLLLIIGTIVIYSQVKFMKSKELGFDKEHLIFIPLRGDTKDSFNVLKQEMLKDQKIVSVTGTGFYPTNIGSNSSGAEWDGKDPDLRVLISFGSAGYDYINTMKIDLMEGRSFSKDFTTDTSSAFLVNEEVAKIMGKESVVGQKFSFVGKEGIIIGVMKNYHFQSVERNIEPLAIDLGIEDINYMLIRLQAGDPLAAVEYAKSAWEKIVPTYPFDHEFVDQRIEKQYTDWEDLSTLLKYFAGLAILIACLGLFGLASFTAEQRTKEIGVRKVLGASVHSIVMLMSREFTKWILVANIFAWPISYFVMNNWLQSFDYRITIGIWTFVFSALLTMLIALVTVSYQAFKAAWANPADALNYE